MTKEWGLPEGLVLLNGDGHWWIALDYRRPVHVEAPTVVWIDIERGNDIQLADDFESFLAGLIPASDLRLGLDE